MISLFRRSLGDEWIFYLSSDTVSLFLIVPDVYLLIVLSMPHISKPKKTYDPRQDDEFTTFCLEQKDYTGETFYVLVGTQVTQNYKCSLTLADIQTRWRKQK